MKNLFQALNKDLRPEQVEKFAEKAPETNEVNIETNANELMHTANTGYGKELIPLNVLTQEIVDLVPKYSSFLGMLPGFHGTDMPISAKVPVIGEVGFLTKNTEQTTGAQALPQPGHRLATGEVQIDQAPLVAHVFVTKRELTYAPERLEEIIKQKLAMSASKTIESMIVNSDTTSAGTGNVNSDDQAAATTFGADDHRLILDNGLRKLALAGAFTVNAGTADVGDLLSVMAKLGENASDPSDLLWLFNFQTYVKFLGVDAFYKANERGARSTLDGNAITNILGADLVTTQALGKTEADGKMSATPSNNTLGQFQLLKKSAVQYGYGSPFEVDVTKVPGRGAYVTISGEFGFGIAQSKAGLADSVVATGINVTL